MEEDSGYKNKFEKEVMEKLIKIETKLDKKAFIMIKL